MMKVTLCLPNNTCLLVSTDDATMSDQEVTRWHINHIYLQPAHTHKSMRVHKQFDLPFTI